MPTFRLSRLAETDLTQISSHTLHEWGKEQTLYYINSIETCCKTLSQNPQLGRPCDKIRTGLRRIEHAKHVIFYRITPYGIFVSRILHERMLPNMHHMS